MTRSVVVVDDEEDIREIARLALEAVMGWQVHLVGTGTEAVDVVARVRPDAVLLDVMMPVQDGPATLAQLHRDERTRTVPVVFLTAKTQASERAELQAMGAAGVLAKPFDPMALGSDIEALLGW